MSRLTITLDEIMICTRHSKKRLPGRDAVSGKLLRKALSDGVSDRMAHARQLVEQARIGAGCQ
ncbi:MAG: CopG family transcriptional regulator [Desulfotignum sp.]|nr:CopG family transcriptional regulator [Desulfotignum sp.]